MKKTILKLVGIALWLLIPTVTLAAYFNSTQLAPTPSNGNCLTTNGSVNAWSPSCGSGSSTPAGSSGQLQYNNNGSFGGTSTPYVTAIVATSTTATSTFAGGFSVYHPITGAVGTFPFPFLSVNNTTGLVDIDAIGNEGCTDCSLVIGNAPNTYSTVDGTGVSNLRIDGGSYAKVSLVSDTGMVDNRKVQMYENPSGIFHLGLLNDAETTETGVWDISSDNGFQEYLPFTDLQSFTSPYIFDQGATRGILELGDYNDNYYGNYLTVDSTNNYQYFNYGDLGIDKTPSYPLDVVGDINTSGCYRISGVCQTFGGSGTVTSVGLAVPTGLTVSNTPITTSGTTTIGLASGYVIPLTASTTQWNNFYNASTSLPYVTSVGLSSTNSTLTIGSSPITTSGTITADLNLAHSNSWTGQQTFVNASSTALSVSTNEWVGGGSVGSSYPFQVHTGTNDNFSVQPPISFTNGIRLRSETDSNSSFEGMEFAANAFTFTGGGNVGIGGIANNDPLETFGIASSTGLQVNGNAVITNASTTNLTVPGTFTVSSVTSTTTATSTFAGSVQVTSGTIVNNEYAPATSSSMTIGWSNGTQQLVKLGHAAVTINLSGVVAGEVLRLPLCQDATGGATVTWDSRVLWAATSTGGANVAPTLSGANHCDLMTFDASNGTSSLVIFGGYLNF